MSCSTTGQAPLLKILQLLPNHFSPDTISWRADGQLLRHLSEPPGQTEWDFPISPSWARKRRNKDCSGGDVQPYMLSQHLIRLLAPLGATVGTGQLLVVTRQGKTWQCVVLWGMGVSPPHWRDNTFCASATTRSQKLLAQNPTCTTSKPRRCYRPPPEEAAFPQSHQLWTEGQAEPWLPSPSAPCPARPHTPSSSIPHRSLLPEEQSPISPSVRQEEK